MKIAVYQPPSAQLPFSLRRYFEALTPELQKLGAELVQFAGSQPPVCDVVWDPYCAGGSYPSWIQEPIRAPVFVTLHGAAPFSLDWIDYYPSLSVALQAQVGILNTLEHWLLDHTKVAKFICPSHYAAQELRECVGVSIDRLVTAYHGVDHEIFNPDGPKAEGVGLLHVAQWQPKKNTSRLVEAWASLPAGARPQLTLVVPGLPEGTLPSFDGLRVINKPLGPCELAALYRGALAFVFPSLHETFGLPVAEAMACGCPVLTSRGTALEELYSEAALIVDPRSVADIRRGLLKLIENADLRGALRSAGIKRAAQLTWQASAKIHMEAFRSVLETREGSVRIAPMSKNRLDNTAVLILGMHRSGTSATAGVLHHLGVDLGPDLMPPGPDNPKGYFEHNGITLLHDELLAALGSSWDDPRMLPSDWTTDDRVAPIHQSLVEIITRDFAGKPLWALKDPRLCRLLPLWLPLLESLGVKVKALLVVRDPAEVAASLGVRNNMPPEQALELWLGHMLLAERDTRHLQRSLVFYEDLLGNWRDEIARIATALELPLVIDDDAATRVETFLSEELRHHRRPQIEYGNVPQFEWATAVFDALHLWRMHGSDPASKLDDVAAEWERAQCAAKSVACYFLNLVERVRAEVEQARAEAAQARAEAEQARADAVQARAEAEQARADLQAVYLSTSWRITAPLRMTKEGLKSLLSLRFSGGALTHAGRASRANTSLFDLAEFIHDYKMHVNVEKAEIRGRQIEVSGWAFSEDYPIDRGVLTLHYGEDVRNIPLTIGIERHDVFYAKGEYRNALRSGFHGKARLGGAVPDKVFVTFFVNDSPIRSRIYPRWRRVSTHRVLAQAWRTASLRRIMRGLTYVLRGEWKYIWYRLLMLSNEADTFEPQPVGLRAALNLVDSEPTLPPALDEPVDIIIPVYNGLEYLEPLFESLRRNTNSPHRLIVIDDASPDPQVWPRLQELLQDHPNALLLRNESNLGFVKTVNRGASHTKGDFVLLNTDVEVPPYWLERLMAPVREDRSVASTTPFSNAATICSFPEMNVDNPGFGDLDVDRIDRWFARIRRDFPKINLPTGIGFCMGVNGEVWQRIGPFDEGAFGRGYGEENDWCLRAAAAGYRNVMVPNLFVYHKHGGSFQSVSRDRLRESNLRTLLARYPDYQQRVNTFIKSDPLLPFRQVMTLFIACGEGAKAPVLIVDHELGGGANSYSKKMIEGRLAADQPVLLLTARRGASLFREALKLRCLYRTYAANFEVEDLGILDTLFSTHLQLAEIFYNNAVSFPRPLALIETLNRIKMATGAQLTIAVHDFYPLCPSYTLLKNEGIYCRLPDASTCRTCLPNNRFAANPENDGIDKWRQTWGKLLRAANRILCFSEDSRWHVEQVYPDCATRITVHPHTINVSFARKPKLNLHAPLHIGVVGAISYPKGAGIVADLARYLLNAHPSVRITVIGTLENNPRLPNLCVTGPYELAELPDLLEQHGINICFLPSICPETFSYVTTELTALDVPLACFDIGAPAERVARYQLGRVICEVSAKAAAEELLNFHRNLSSQAAELNDGNMVS